MHAAWRVTFVGFHDIRPKVANVGPRKVGFMPSRQEKPLHRTQLILPLRVSALNVHTPQSAGFRDTGHYIEEQAPVSSVASFDSRACAPLSWPLAMRLPY